MMATLNNLSSLLDTIDQTIEFIMNSDTGAVTEEDPSSLHSLQKCDDLSTCAHFKNYIQTMQIIFNPSAMNMNMDNINILCTLNNFIHLLNNHCDDNEQFEHIIHTLGTCDINNCEAFMRHHRDRNGTKNTNCRHKLYKHCCTDSDVSRCQVLDKLHCYFSHCFDIGNRFTINELSVINEIKQDENVD
eukprot:499428_1